MAITDELDSLIVKEKTLENNKVAPFCYEQSAYENDNADGVDLYNSDAAQNIPLADNDILQVNPTVLTKGYRSQASSITRMIVNHFFGRTSYNLNKVNDIMLSLLNNIKNSLNVANGIAKLDENANLSVTHGGTGASDSKGAQYNLLENMNELSTEAVGDTKIACAYEAGSEGSGAVYKRPLSTLSSFIRGLFSGSNGVNYTPSSGALSVDSSHIRGLFSGSNGVNYTPSSGEFKLDYGQTSANAFINSLEFDSADPKDNDCYVCQWAGGNEANPVNMAYTRRPILKLWNYIKGKISSVLGLTKDNYGGTAAAILDYYDKNTPIKVRWAGPEIVSAEWYPAFNASGSALEPIRNTNIHAGTAGSATKLQTARYIDGVAFDGSANIYHYAVCNTEANTTVKEFAVSNFELVAGTRLFIKFTNGNTAGATFNNNSNILSSSYTPRIRVNNGDISHILVGNECVGANFVRPDEIHEFVYDGSYWQDVTTDIIYRDSNSRGYFLKYRNGLIEQWGTGYVDSNKRITFPIPFTDTNYKFDFSVNLSSNGNVTWQNLQISNYSKSAVSLLGIWATNIPIQWCARGY